MASDLTQRYAPSDKRQLWMTLAWLSAWWTMALAVGLATVTHVF